MKKQISQFRVRSLGVVVLSLFVAQVSWGGFKKPEKTPCDAEDHYSEISFEDLKPLVDKGAVTLLDVNSAKSFNETRIPGAIHFPTEEKNLSAKLPADKAAALVAYCGGPKCEAWFRAAKAACRMGYTNVKHFKGGITGWNKLAKSS